MKQGETLLSFLFVRLTICTAVPLIKEAYILYLVNLFKLNVYETYRDYQPDKTSMSIIFIPLKLCDSQCASSPKVGKI